MDVEARKTIDFLRKRASENIYIPTSPGSLLRLAKLIERLARRVQELEKERRQ